MYTTQTHLLAALETLESILRKRLNAYFAQEPFNIAAYEAPLQECLEMDIALSRFVKENELDSAVFLTLLLALSSQLRPGFLDDILQKDLPKAGDFPAMGGQRGKNYRGILPTGETVMFLLGVDTLAERLQQQKMFDNQHFLSQRAVLYLEEVPPGEPPLSGKLVLAPEFVQLFTEETYPLPKLSARFPASHLKTAFEWSDLVLPQKTFAQISEVLRWVTHHRTLDQDWQMAGRIKPGYRALFHGPPGTGKTMAATLLGKQTGREVFRIDLSLIVSKYIGETEKNLGALFDRAKHQEWILFFDEADALFGKRTNVRDAHDRYANQETAYLLQRVESYPGLVILASNLKNNLDDAFTRRFQSMIHFPMPAAAERLQLWEKSWPSKVKLAKDIDLRAIAQQYELTGANIINIVQYACLIALEQDTDTISRKALLMGIRKEYGKEGKIL